MKAILIHRFGGPENIKLEDRPLPDIKDDQLLVEIYDAGVNPIDWKTRANVYQAMSDADLPLIMGQDFAGLVVDAGAKVQKFKEGDRVFGFTNQGAYAEYGVTDEKSIAHLPETIDYVVGATLPTPGLTAYQMVVDIARVESGMSVLIQGAAGAVGTFALQLCKRQQASVIVTGAPEDFEYLKRIGADEVINYKTEKFEDRVKDLDVVLDLVGGDITTRSMTVIKKGGIIVSTTHTVKKEDALKLGIRGVNVTMRRDAEELAKLASLIEQNIMHARIDHVMNLDQAKEAQEESEKVQTHGKIILQILP